jgi:alkane 1-monooxygenase
MTFVCLNTVGSGHAFIDNIMRLSGFHPEAARNATNFYTGVGGLVSLGMVYGVAGVNGPHALVHRTKSPLDMVLGRWLLANTWDTGFAIEHVYGHHRNVGTQKDPATARRGEYVLAFVVRSSIGQVLSALNFENERLQRRGISNTIISNRFWRGQIMTLCVIAFFTFLVGPFGIFYSALAAFVGKIYLEIVNYVEHYGLVRIAGNRIEDRHSWDSHRRISSGLTYNLPLHSNHHRFATRPFWELQHAQGDAPLWPMGYVVMIIISFFPSLWRKISDPLLADWDKRLASSEERAYLTSINQLRE